MSTLFAWTSILPVLIVLSSLIPGLLIFATPEHARTRRTVLNLIGIGVKMLLVALMLLGVSQGLSFRFELPFLP